MIKSKKIVFICGGGTSLIEGVEKGLWDKLKESDLEVWSLNYAFRAMPYLPHKQLWVDRTFFKNNMNDLENLAKQGVHCITKKEVSYAFIENIELRESVREFNKATQDIIFRGQMGLVGMFALHYAIIKEYDEIYLGGYDFSPSPNNECMTHFYQGKIPYVSSGVGRPHTYKESNTGKPKKGVYDFDYLKREGIYNVSLISKIESFPKISFEDFFERIK